MYTSHRQLDELLFLVLPFTSVDFYRPPSSPFTNLQPFIFQGTFIVIPPLHLSSTVFSKRLPAFAPLSKDVEGYSTPFKLRDDSAKSNLTKFDCQFPLPSDPSYAFWILGIHKSVNIYQTSNMYLLIIYCNRKIN